jgi:uncharacterized protein (DUF433 family)
LRSPPLALQPLSWDNHGVGAIRRFRFSQELRAGVMKKTETPPGWISKEPDRCGGDACIRDCRIPVWVLVNYRRLGGTEANLLRDYPSLTPADLEAAWRYAAANTEEIDRAIRENEEGDSESTGLRRLERRRK